MKLSLIPFLGLSLLTTLLPVGAQTGNDYYMDDLLYVSRPHPQGEKLFGNIGATGLRGRIYPGVILTVESMAPGSPSVGKFVAGEIITGINGTALIGLNPFEVMGNALTQAEATDGKMIFDVTAGDGTNPRQETVTIPILGAYTNTWPLNCPKSQRIINEAAAFYSNPQKFNQGGIPGALSCLFLLSTGDDQYLPRVKAYFDAFPDDVSQIGDSTWDNGYNGIACGEYYLRTGDQSVLPIMQYYCDDAKNRQKFDCGWGHWSNGINPGYVAGGLLNAAGTQLLTVMLLGKECGVNVDEQTLLNTLRFHYRFTGHGGAAYGDHRAEGWHSANGKDGMAAAAMRIASGSQGDVSIYQEATRSLAKGIIDGYLWLAVGHGDEGRSDGIWRSLTTSYLMDEKPALFREAMDRLTWFHDLSREPGGSIGIATLDFYGSALGGHSGPGVGLSYTAPLKKLRITGAPRTQFSQNFTLPASLWGTTADRAFLSIEHNPTFHTYPGSEEPLHVLFKKLGYSNYRLPDFNASLIDRDFLRKNMHHWSCVVRTEAAKTLRTVGALDELTNFLSDPDPRVRRAALDGLTGYNWWSGGLGSAISTAQLSPAMLTAITNMLSNPAESWYVVDGALLALKIAPANEIQSRKGLIMPWTTHPDWWLRESAFAALSGLEKDDALYLAILPTLLDMATKEYHTMPRNETMKNHFTGVLQNKGPSSAAGQLIMAGLQMATTDSEIKSPPRYGEGSYNVVESAKLALRFDPSIAAAIAIGLQPRLVEFNNNSILDLVGELRATLVKLDSTQRQELEGILYDIYRPELVKRYNAGDAVGDDGAVRPALLRTIADLAKIGNPAVGWLPVSKTPPSQNTWRFKSINPTRPEDIVPINVETRFRNILLPPDLNDWFKTGYNDSAWNSGLAPVGTDPNGTLWGVTFPNQSAWGSGEYIVMRTSFEVESLDFDLFRLGILTPQGFKIYLNGQEIASYGWWFTTPSYAPWDVSENPLDSSDPLKKHLKIGTNLLAVLNCVQYNQSTQQPYGQMDCIVEGLKLAGIGIDVPPTTISALYPNDNATKVSVAADLVATFNENITIGTGNIRITNVSNGQITNIAISDTEQVAISDNVLTITPMADLLPNTNYAIQIDSTAIKDLNNFSFAGITNDTTWNFTTRVSPLVTPLPVSTGLALHLDAAQITGLSDGATVNTWSDMSGLDNHATKSAGTPVYKTGVLNAKPVVRFNGSSSFTTADLSSQFPSAATGFIVTTLSNDNAYTLVKANPGSDEWWRWNSNGRSYPKFFRGNRLESYCAMPNTGTHLFAITSSASAWEMSINGASQGVASGNYNAGGALVIGNGSSGGGLNGDIAEVILYNRVLTSEESNTIGLYLEAKYGLATSYEPSPAISTYSPADNATGVALGANFVATFSKNIAKGTGNITVKNLTDATQTTIPVTDAQVTVSGSTLTINPTANLLPAKSYAIRIAATAIVDTVGGKFAGISDDRTWSFATVPDTFPPEIATYSPNSAIGVALIATFNENIKKGTGDITIKNLTDATQTTIPVTDAQVTVSGATLTINPTANLAADKNYAIQIAAAAIMDLANNSFAGIANDTTWNFATAASYFVPPVTAGLRLHLDASQLTGLSDGATVATWSDMSGLNNHATNNAGTPKYKTGVLNGRPVIRFDGYSSFTTANLSSQFPSAATGFIVTTLSNDDAYTLVKANPGVDEWWRWNGNGRSYPGFFRGNRLESYCAMPNSGTHLFAISSSASAWEMSINGVSQGVAGGNYNAGGVLMIGNHTQSNRSLNGDIAEVLIYNRVLTAAESSAVGSHLSVKYGLATSYDPPPGISTYSPADNSTDVAVNANFVATFSENIVKGTGNITIRNVTDNINTTIAVTDAQVTVSGATLTINPTANLLAGKNYAIQIAATAIKDMTNNSYPGITNDMTWNFTTASAAGGAPKVINVDFNGSATYSGTGAAPDPGTVWKGLNSTAMNEPLLDSTGAASTVTLTAGSGVAGFGAGSVNALLVDYLYNTGNSTTTTSLAGLTPGSAFSLYLYGSGDKTNQCTTFTLSAANGGASASTTGSDRTAFATPANYVVLSGTADSSGNINFTWTAAPSTTQYGVLNGLQLVMSGSDTPDTTAPTPNPMTFASPPASSGSTSITMTATTATDPSGIEYFFECTAGAGHSSTWQNSPTYTDTGLTAASQYSYRVRARDKSPAQTATDWSADASATTAPDTTAPMPDPLTFATPPAALGQTSITMTATTASDPSGVEYSFECTSGGGHSSAWQNSPTYTDTGLTAASQYSYRVRARDKSPAQTATAWSAAASATTAPDTTAPSPNPMTFASPPASSGSTAITMTATTATDPSGVEYSFECTSGGGHSSAWQNSPTYTDTGLTAASQYSYRVRARDKSAAQTATAWSAAASATTAPDTTAPSPNPMTFASPPASSGSTAITMTATTATDPSGVEYFFECTSGGGHSSAWQASPTYIDTGLTAATQYSYRARARDKSAAQTATAWSAAPSATTANTPYGTWSGGAAFDGDANNDGVGDGMAWLLGVGDLTENAVGKLPQATRSGTHLRLTFRCLKSTMRGGVVLKVQCSSDCGASDSWATHEAAVPDTDATVNDVVFDTTDDGDYINVIADIPAPGSAKLFARLSAVVTAP